MIVILTVSFTLALFLTLFVLTPLFNLSHKKITADPIFEQNAKALFSLKEELFAQILNPSLSNPTFMNLSDKEIRERLYDTCEKLDDLKIDWQQQVMTHPNSQSGFACLKFMFIASLLCVGLSFIVPAARAQDEPQTPSDVTIPGPIIMPGSGYWLPAVNQFILMPKQGTLHVYYVGMFSNTFEAAGTKIILPLPRGAKKIQIRFMSDTQLEPSSLVTESDIVLNSSLEKSVNQIQAEFDIAAPFGIATWQKRNLDTLSGVSIFIIPQSSSALLDTFPNLLSQTNVAPARVVAMPFDFKSFVSSDVLKGEAPAKGQARELSQQYIRVGDMNSLYPEFKVVGLVPARTSLYAIVIFFAGFFLAGLIYFFYRTRVCTTSKNHLKN